MLTETLTLPRQKSPLCLILQRLAELVPVNMFRYQVTISSSLSPEGLRD